ncbi:hypothetical protein HOG98_05345 [bacterium]|jgi:peptidyl-prolyl cis-trans isomerase C|nr:hypothetical protein [bacterium]
MNKKISLLLLCITSAILSSGFFNTTPDNAIAKVNKTFITNPELKTKISQLAPQNQDALKSKEAKVQVLDQMINEELLLLAAQKEGISKTADYKKLIEKAKNQILVGLIIDEKINKNISVTADDLKNYYKSNPNLFRETEMRLIRHILVAKQSSAEGIKREIDNGGSFSDFAKQYSQDPSSRKNGGSLGWFSKDQLSPDFAAVAFGIKKAGDISNVVNTEAGFHIVLVEDIKTRQALTFEDVAQQLDPVVRNLKRRELTSSFLNSLKNRFPVERYIKNIKD